MNDLEWSMLSYYVIYYEKFKKVMQRTKKEALKINYVKHKHCLLDSEKQILLATNLKQIHVYTDWVDLIHFGICIIIVI